MTITEDMLKAWERNANHIECHWFDFHGEEEELAKQITALIDLVRRQREMIEKKDELIKNQSDGYHTFAELYEHRVLLFINLCLLMPQKAVIGPKDGDWFVIFLELPTGQISYHMHVKYLPLVTHTITTDQTHKWDGHKSPDVVNRLQNHALALTEQLK